MIDIRELHNEQKAIADQIIKTIHGESVVIPYFTYHGPCKNRDWVMRGKRGIYIFTVTESVDITPEMIRTYNDAKNCNGNLVGAGFNWPYPKRLNLGDVFYLGKVSGISNSIYRRLKIHFGDRTDSATNGIKMKMPHGRFIDGKLEVHTFLFEKSYEEVMQIIIDPVEKILHEKLDPITGGKQ